MTRRVRSKYTRKRGNTTHCLGARKKGRGKGNRGGCGNAGLGKRAKQKKPSIWENKLHFGKHGFKPKNSPIFNPVTLRYLDNKIFNLEKLGIAKRVDDSYQINLEEIGFDKLIGSGNTTKKMIIKVKYATPSAIKKIESVGGRVETEEKIEEEEQ